MMERLQYARKLIGSIDALDDFNHGRRLRNDKD